jgi:aryl-alcohol dehydrogenase-like predicted oxidoreductase
MLKHLLLGTAQWGWTMTPKQAFDVLDVFYESGFRQIDCATNYPINKIENDFRQAEKIISTWLKINGVKDLKVMIKIGSLNNLRTPDCNLTPSFLLMSLEYYRSFFQENLDTLMLHWDNREDEIAVRASFESLQAIHNQGFSVGISGIKNPDLYAAINADYDFDFYIQIKHNILQSDYERYIPFHRKARFIAYGINAGGVKLDVSAYGENSVLAIRGGDLNNNNEKLKAVNDILAKANKNKNRPPISEFFQLGMFHVANSGIESCLVAPSNPSQWKTTLEFYQTLQQFDYQDIKL